MPRREDRNRRRRVRKSSFDRRKPDQNNKRDLAHESSGDEMKLKLTAAQIRAVEELLSGIGVPEPTPFVPDQFQLEALAAIENEDVLVTAPTGSGKTWIAREEIRRLLEKGKKAWYTTPLKALTNSKYLAFSKEFGPDSVGILTGDRKENADAPLIVGTTEIYRNQLFDALRCGNDVDADLVILDEAHYLADDDRGHVWEEAIILTPPRIRMLLLSATVGEANVFAAWMEHVRGAKVHVIDRAGKRPVELRSAYLSIDLQLFPLMDSNGKLDPAVDAIARPNSKPRRRRRQGF